MGEASVLDATEDPPQDPGRVLHRFLVPDLRSRRPQVRDVGALVVCGDLESDPRPPGGLLEDEGDVLAAETLLLVPPYLAALRYASLRRKRISVGL
jgi:hypothetical protein